jgi:hypothetical protein
VKWVVISGAVVVGIVLLDRVLLAFEARGWIFYRRNKPNFQNAGSVFLEFQAMFEPRMRHVIEQKRQEQQGEDADEDGDPPVPLRSQPRAPGQGRG